MKKRQSQKERYSLRHRLIPPIWDIQSSQIPKKNVVIKSVKSESLSVVSDSSRPHGPYSSWNSPDQNTGVGTLSLLQGIFPTQGIKPRSPVLQVDSLPAEPQGKPYQECGEGEMRSCYKMSMCFICARWINSRGQLYSTVLIGSNTVM